MKYEKYDIEASSTFLKFEFISNGPKGNIRKQVIFKQTDNLSVYNLGFGEIDPATGEINDIVITNSSDSQKVLATLALTVLSFFENIQINLFLQQEVRNPAPGYTGWGFRVTLKKYKRNLKYLVIKALSGKSLRKKRIMTLFLSEKNHNFVTVKILKSNTKKSTGRAAKIKVNKKLDGFEDAPFFKKKMAKANKILSLAPLPR